MAHHMARRRARGGRGPWVLLGLSAALLAFGVIFGGGVASLLWPLFVMAPALALFYLVRQAKRLRFLTIPATMLATVGALLFVSNLTGFWSIWSYAWALVFPGAFGLGLSVYGELTRKRAADRWGESLAKAGIGIFLVGLVLNLLFGLSGLLIGLLPMLLVGTLVYLVLRNRKPKRPASIRGSRYDTLGDGSSTLDLDSALWQEERERV